MSELQFDNPAAPDYDWQKDRPHDYDDDSVCRGCGFDGAEWWHLERMKPKDDRDPEPPCERR